MGQVLGKTSTGRDVLGAPTKHLQLLNYIYTIWSTIWPVHFQLIANNLDTHNHNTDNHDFFCGKFEKSQFNLYPKHSWILQRVFETLDYLSRVGGGGSHDSWVNNFLQRTLQPFSHFFSRILNPLFSFF